MRRPQPVWLSSDLVTIIHKKFPCPAISRELAVFDVDDLKEMTKKDFIKTLANNRENPEK